MSQHKAFTLVELLVVISVIGILSGFVFVQTNNAVNSGKDAKRKSDIALLASAAVGYQSESIDMPISSGCSINVDCPTVVNEALEGQIGTLPVDPNSGSAYQYQSIDGTDCTISAVLSTGETYQYSCSGDEISQSAPVAGVCGSRANSSSSGYPSSQTDWTSDTTYCTSTTPSTTPAFPATPGSSVSWSCPGTYLGESTTCTAYRALDGVCGSGATNTYTIPTANFCSSGTASSVSGSGPWTWTCAGVYGGTTPTCTANKSVDGVCGSSNGTYIGSAPTTNLCSVGTASSVSGSGPWTWTCAGVYSGTTPNCTTVDATYAVISFTAIGSQSWTVPTGVTSIDYLVVAGGGGGGHSDEGAGAGGGGGGGVVFGTTTVTPGASISLTVGDGGNPGTCNGCGGSGGGNSVFASYTGYGGGGGGSSGGYGMGGGSGGSGGGGCNSGGGAGSQGYGGGGGSGRNGGGGGGMGSAGISNGGSGGAGILSGINGSPLYYGAGGNGGNYGSGATGATGAANTGNGGGGGGGADYNPRTGGKGGSGVVIVRYINNY